MHYVVPALGPAWLDPQYILAALGPWALWGAVAIVFAECGLLIGFFLPGDSLLFTVGLMISGGYIDHPLWLGCVVLIIAAFLGNAVGYEIGRRTGPAIFSKEDSRIFKKEHVDKTIAFFDKYGSRAILLARFVPIVRTFITVTAGVGQMDRRRYLFYSGIGGTLWAGGVTLLGSVLGRFAFVQNNLETILLSIVLISVIPMIIEYLRERAKTRRAASDLPPSAAVATAGVVGTSAEHATAEAIAAENPTAHPDPTNAGGWDARSDVTNPWQTAPAVPVNQPRWSAETAVPQWRGQPDAEWPDAELPDVAPAPSPWPIPEHGTSPDRNAPRPGSRQPGTGRHVN